MLEKLILSAIISSKILTIYDEKLNRNVRPTFNIFIRKPFGFGFSTMFFELVERGYVNYINEFSVAGIVGSVRGGRIYKGSLAESGFKLTVFDEVMSLENKAKKTLLELSEHNRVTRDIQGFVEKRIEKAITGGKYVAEEGKLILQIHTSCIFGSASDSVMTDQDIKMLLSRCFCLNLTMDVEEAFKLKTRGRKIIVNEDIIPDQPIEKVVLPTEVNEYILSEMTKDLRVPEDEGGYYTRCHDDLIRLSAVHCVARGDTIISKKDAKFSLQFYPLHQVGFLGSQISETSLKIYQHCRGLTVKELSRKLKLSDRTIYKHLQKLIELRLVSKVGDKYYKAH